MLRRRPPSIGLDEAALPVVFPAFCGLVLEAIPVSREPTDSPSSIRPGEAFSIFTHSAPRSSPETKLCERYAEVAGRVVNEWYPSLSDRYLVGGLVGSSPIGSLVPETYAVPRRTIEWSCAPQELSLVLDLPENDVDADLALGDILSALSWKGLNPKKDKMKIAVEIARTADSATFDPEHN